MDHNPTKAKSYNRQGVKGYIVDCSCGNKGGIAKTAQGARDLHARHIARGESGPTTMPPVKTGHIDFVHSAGVVR